MVQQIAKVLMERDGLSEVEAWAEVDYAREELALRLEQGEMPFDICEELFGLEPDYIEELIF